MGGLRYALQIRLYGTHRRRGGHRSRSTDGQSYVAAHRDVPMLRDFQRIRWSRDVACQGAVSLEDLDRVIYGSQFLTRAATGNFVSLTNFRPPSSCRSRTTCVVAGSDLAGSLAWNKKLDLDGSAILDSMYTRLWDRFDGASEAVPCTDCKRSLRAFESHFRARVWHRLPCHFELDIPSWIDLGKWCFQENHILLY